MKTRTWTIQLSSLKRLPAPRKPKCRRNQRTLQLSAILLARVLGYVETADLSPTGKLFFPEITQALVNRYEFKKFPQSLEEYDEQKGVEFLEGRSGDTVVQKFTVFSTL